MADKRNRATDDAHAGGRMPPSPGYPIDGEPPASDGPAGGPAAGEVTQRMPADQPTSVFDPLSDGEGDDAAHGDADGDADGDATTAMPADSDATRAMPADSDATRAMPADSDATRPIPASGDATRGMAPQIWAARVHVPPADVEPAHQPAAAPWQDGYGYEQDRSPVRPAVITLVVVILLAMLGTGLWLIFSRAGERRVPAPGAPTPTSEAAVPPPIATATPTETATGTATPTVEPTAQPPAPPPPPPPPASQVAVPNLVGMSETVAKQRLTAMGLTYQVSRRPTTGATPGTVIATEPGSGSMVDKGTQVTLYIAAAPPSPSAASSASGTGTGIGTVIGAG